MQNLITEIQDKILYITFNRSDKHNAFDEHFLAELQLVLDEASLNQSIRVIVLKGAGKHFSSGADLNWMKRMAEYSEAENLKDAEILAKVLSTLYNFPKPTIAMVHGLSFGGGAGLVAAADIAIAATNAEFCFSEVKLGLIPAVISPYVIKAIGARAASWLFISTEKFTAERAYELNLVQYITKEEELSLFSHNLAKKIANLPPEAVLEAKALVKKVADKPIDESLQQMTALWIAKKRGSSEAQLGLQAFLNKRSSNV